MKRRTFLKAGLVASSAAANCVRTDREAPKGTLRVGAGSDRYNTAPGRFTLTTSRPNAHVGEPPARPNNRFEARPWLFESWTHEGEGAYVAHLRPGVLFHDGTAFTADTFITSARQFIATRDFIGLDPASLRRVDDGSVRFRSKTGSALMVDNMTHPSACLFLPRDQAGRKPIGTGPYRMVRYEPQRVLEVERFDGYWGGQSKQPRVMYRFLADPQTRLLALRASEVDIVSDVVPEMLLSIEKNDPGVTVLRSRPIRYAALFCNLHGAPPFHTLRDLRVRRALALAIDREALARVMYMGQAVPARGVLPGWMFNLGDEFPRGFGMDTAQATRLLDDAGWTRGADGMRARDGQRLRLRMVSAFPNASSVKPMPEMLAQMFSTIGVATEIVEVEDEQVYYSAYADRGQADLFLELAGNANADPTFLLYNAFHTATPWPSYRFHAPGAEVDARLDAARHGTVREEIVAHVREAHRLIVDKHVAVVPLLSVPAFVLTRPGVAINMFENVDWIDFGDATIGA